MRFYALASDFDGTLAKDGRVDSKVISGLERLKKSGRRLIMVTGRQLDDLKKTFPQIDLFEAIVAENGACLFVTATKEEKTLVPPPEPIFLRELERRGIGNISVGKGIVASWKPNETAILEVIRDLGLELEIIFNKGAIMVLPTGCNKGFGLKKALKGMSLSPHNVAGIGDAENDHVFLSLCECNAVVSNAIPPLKAKADIVTSGDHGNGVLELIENLLEDDLASLIPRLSRHEIPLGREKGDGELSLPPYHSNLLLAGTSGGGKSTFAMSFFEKLDERK